ncbi:hypothetical protein EVAR_49698_1 [Eumeta japonica]|uniref:Uncharacterized protein n=1 Tax=Eumeta variegata TaxID=151549 RepID=A0A4C1Z651_EUMVA|nr:hypothetical protein EVAR_49698_1 [Eumeta japonica]
MHAVCRGLAPVPPPRDDAFRVPYTKRDELDLFRCVNLENTGRPWDKNEKKRVGKNKKEKKRKLRRESILVGTENPRRPTGPGVVTPSGSVVYSANALPQWCIESHRLHHKPLLFYDLSVAFASYRAEQNPERYRHAVDL